MDERRWWIANKVHETFGIGGSECNPSLLEEFVRHEPVNSMINQFLSSGGPCRLFFYCNRAENEKSSGVGVFIRVVGSLATIKDTKLENLLILYMFRSNTDHEVDASCIEKEIMCGELKGNLIGNLNNILTEVYIPLLKAKTQWGQCSKENQAVLFHNLDKAVSGLSEAGVGAQHSKQTVTISIEYYYYNNQRHSLKFRHWQTTLV